jgi:uncharacterized protein YfkK (UPF0435 family)
LDYELRLVKVRGDEIVFRLPIHSIGDSMLDDDELDEDEIERLTNIYALASNKKRLRVMMELKRGRELSFTDVLEVAENPKLVRDCMDPMMSERIVTHGSERGACYRPSDRGSAISQFMTMGLLSFLRALDEEFEEGGALE